MKNNTFQKIMKIGEGTYGKVILAKDTRNNQLVAIKKIKLDPQQEGIPNTALRQIAILKKLNHPNIVKLFQVIYEPQQNKLLLIFQYINQDLSKHIMRVKQLSQYILKSYLHQILAGVKYLHQNRVFHRDLKPQNILVTKDGSVKIADFGLARLFTVPLQTYTHQIQTLWYRSPQLLLGCHKYSLAVDIWSIGCIFYQMAERKVLFQGTCQYQQILKIFNYHGTPNLQSWPQLANLPFFNVKIDKKKNFPRFPKSGVDFQYLQQQGRKLLNKMIGLQGQKRITVQQALNHQYFEGMQYSG